MLFFPNSLWKCRLEMFDSPGILWSAAHSVLSQTLSFTTFLEKKNILIITYVSFTDLDFRGLF